MVFDAAGRTVFRRPLLFAVHGVKIAFDDVVLLRPRLGKAAERCRAAVRADGFHGAAAFKGQHQQHGQQGGEEARADEQQGGDGVAHRPQKLVGGNLSAAAHGRSGQEHAGEAEAAQHEGARHRAEDDEGERAERADARAHLDEGEDFEHAENEKTDTESTNKYRLRPLQNPPKKIP